jgi:predicted RNA binding protein YcfA (HicA-like mRNA interferase family)
MKLPRDLSGETLAKALKKLGYTVDHQTGSHIRLTTQKQGEHHITIPNHSPIKIGTPSAILRGLEVHFNLTRDELLNQLFS